MREVLAASRPFSWINTAYPFAAGYLLATGGRVDATFVVGTLFFLGPYNLLMYGINDVFDYASDLRNPRKGGIEGGLVEPARAREVHRRILWACLVTTVPFVVYLLLVGDAAANATLALVLFLVVAYSAPVLRFKERPVLDSLTSAMHFVGPLLYALVLVGADLGASTTWPVLVAFVLWGMASHAFGAVQDVRADREGGIASVATALGAHPTVVASTVLYVLAAAVLLVVPWPGTLAAVLPIPYAISTAQFWSVRDEDCERANAGWRRFLWLNLVTGFLVTMLLIVIARSCRAEAPGVMRRHHADPKSGSTGARAGTGRRHGRRRPRSVGEGSPAERVDQVNHPALKLDYGGVPERRAGRARVISCWRAIQDGARPPRALRPPTARRRQ